MSIKQVIGCAYTFKSSLARRRYEAGRGGREDHSAVTPYFDNKDFSYFRKSDSCLAPVGNGESLVMSRDGFHWYEPELALLIGENNEIIACTLANDFTAAQRETRASDRDPTHEAKYWQGSLAIGKDFAMRDLDGLDIRIKIERGDDVYSQSYNTSKRIIDFSNLPKMIVELHSKLLRAGNIAESKRIEANENLLPEGTVVLAGTGLIPPPKWYAEEGDVVTVSARGFEDLANRIVGAGDRNIY